MHKRTRSGLLAGAAFVLLALLRLSAFFPGPYFLNGLFLLACLWTAAVLFLGKRGVPLCVGFCALVPPALYAIRSISGILYFLGFLGLALVGLACLRPSAARRLAGKLWFVPAVCTGLSEVLSFRSLLSSLSSQGYSIGFLAGRHLPQLLPTCIVTVAAVLFAAKFAAGTPVPDDAARQLSSDQVLLDSGILTQEEFDQTKKTPGL